ncbi:MAG: porin family protein [Cyclobacteriaceae bacterium]
MKPYLYLIIAFLITGNSAQAQHANIGIKGGLNGYTIEGDNSGGNDLKLSFNLGLLAHFHLGNQFALQPELVYSGQGTQRKIAGSNVDLNLNYVNIPLLFQYMFDNGFRLEAGPQLGILSSAKSVIGNNSIDVKSDYESTDVSIAMGMSYVKPSTGFGFDIRYNYGLTNINKSNTSNAYNRGWQLGFFYLFEHKS